MIPGCGGFAARVGARLNRALAEYRARRAVRELQRLDERTLKDIGLSRSFLDAAVRSRQTRTPPFNAERAQAGSDADV
jgi:uncharacterized protein YjiS (DUF1127 family)